MINKSRNVIDADLDAAPEELLPIADKSWKGGGGDSGGAPSW